MHTAAHCATARHQNCTHRCPARTSPPCARCFHIYPSKGELYRYAACTTSCTGSCSAASSIAGAGGKQNKEALGQVALQPHGSNCMGARLQTHYAAGALCSKFSRQHNSSGSKSTGPTLDTYTLQHSTALLRSLFHKLGRYDDRWGGLDGGQHNTLEPSPRKAWDVVHSRICCRLLSCCLFGL